MTRPRPPAPPAPRTTSTRRGDAGRSRRRRVSLAARHGGPLAGLLVVAALVGCALPDDAPFGRRCDDDDDCAQGYVCEQDQCVPFAGFFDDPGCRDDVDCDDGLFCTPAEACRDGACVPAADLVCQGRAQCFESNDQCLECTATVPCLDDGDDCTEQLCDVLRGCVAVPLPACVRCDVDDDCAPASACEVGGACVRHRCTFEQRDCGGRGCDPTLGCRCVGVGAAAGCEPAPCGSAVCTPEGACELSAPLCDAAACLVATGTCAACTLDADCDLDADPCTADRCDATRGVCVVGDAPCPAKRCIAEQGVAQCVNDCDDDGACVSNDPCQPAGTCDAGACTFPAALTCDTGFGCVVDTAGSAPRCRACLVNDDCPDDDNPCTDAACADGRCRQLRKPCLFGCDPASVDGACFACASALDCDDVSSCTVDACVDGACVHRVASDEDASSCGALGCLENVGRCAQCDEDNDCLRDRNACTEQRCVEGVCAQVATTTCEGGCLPASGCGTCVDAASCNDGDDCTDDGCTDGVCTHAARAGCGPECTAPSDCDDDDACTGDFCTDGACVRVPRSDCPDTCDPTTGLCLP